MLKTFSKTYSKLRQRLTPRKLAGWRSGGILLTYSCSAECADCYENSSPRKRSTLPIDDIREYLRELKKLGLTGDKLHFAGGEPFYNYKHLIRCFEVAREEGMLPLGKLETNAFWCKNDELVRERLGEIRDFGLGTLVVSSDVFHQEFVPMEKVRRAVRIGKEVLGEDAVRVNSWEFFDDPVDVMKMTEEEKLEAFRDTMGDRPWRIVGRAAKNLSHLVRKHPKETFAGDGCARRILRRGSIHIDPHGNLFPSICAGVIIGNAKKQPLSEIHETFDYRDHPMVRTLVEQGPLPLMEEAIERGFAEDKEGYATKCHVCFAARTFFWEQGLHGEEVGPGEIYTD